MKKIFHSSSFTYLLLLTVVILFSLPAVASRPRLKSGSSVDLPSIGLKIKLPRGAEATPAQSLTVIKLHRRRGDIDEQVNSYNLKELWLHSQLKGIYLNAQFSVRIYLMELPRPAGIETLNLPGNKLVTMEKYNNWEKQQPTQFWNKREIISWINYLLNREPEATLTNHELFRSGAGDRISQIKSPDLPPTRRLYLAISASRPLRYVIIDFKLQSEVVNKKSFRTLNYCLKNIKFYPPQQLTYHRKDEQNNSLHPISQYKASRQQVIESIQNRPGWWYIEANNFIIVADISNRHTIKELKAGLLRSRAVFSELYPLMTPLQAISVVKVFATRQEYLNYIGPQYRWTGGLWMSSKKELVISPVNFGSERAKRKLMVNVIQHEGFHQYIYFATGEQQTAVWFNEGNATFFEGIKYRRNRPFIVATDRLEPGRQAALHCNDINTLLQMSYPEFYGPNKRYNYALGYALIFFLQKGAPVMKGKDRNNYHQIPLRYYQAIIKNKNPRQATTAAWQGIDMTRFNKLFHKFWSSRTLIKRAIRYHLLKSDSPGSL